MPVQSTVPPAPLQQLILSEADFANPQQFLLLLNQQLTNHAQQINRLQGFSGPIKFNNHVDLTGNRLMNLGSAVEAGDGVSQGFAGDNYSAAALAPQIQALGKSALQSYRRISDKVQREKYSSFLNSVLTVAPTSNTSTVAFSAPSGGFVPTTVSAGLHQLTDGSIAPYAAFNDSLQVPTTYTISGGGLSRSGGIVSGATSGANTLTAGETVVISSAGDSSFDGQFVLLTAVSPNFTYAQSLGNATTTGGTISLAGVYYYLRRTGSNVLYRVGPYALDSWTNRLTAGSAGAPVPSLDGSTIIAVVAVNGSGGDTVNSAAGATAPATNMGAPTRLFGRL